jgi:hypothetical protein
MRIRGKRLLESGPSWAHFPLEQATDYSKANYIR